MEQKPKIHKDSLPTIALVGRVNVGKSTLFNTLIEENKAIVSSVAGTTRTSNEGIILWRGKELRIIDTGGLTFTDEVPLEADIIKQTEHAMNIADIVVFITDAKAGILPQERELARRLRKIIIKPVLLVANKADSKKIDREMDIGAWLKLGLGEPFLLSATSGKNLGDFLDAIHTLLETLSKPAQDRKEPNADIVQITIIGKPNVGKSSLFNKLIGQEKVIVSDMPHTTREPYDTLVTYHYTDWQEQEEKTATNTSPNQKEKTLLINFIDTAGIRRKTKVSGELEQKGIMKSIQRIETSDIILFVLDGSETISSQDKQLGGLIERRGKSVIILVNKWDLATDTSDSKRNAVKKMIYAQFPHLDFAPILFVSGKTGYRVHAIFPELAHVWQARHTKPPVKGLEYVLKQTIASHLPSRGKGTRFPKILGIRQIGVAPPVIELVIKHKTSLHESYTHFLERNLREHFDFTGVPVIITLRKQKK